MDRGQMLKEEKGTFSMLLFHCFSDFLPLKSFEKTVKQILKGVFKC